MTCFQTITYYLQCLNITHERYLISKHNTFSLHHSQWTQCHSQEYPQEGGVKMRSSSECPRWVGACHDDSTNHSVERLGQLQSQETSSMLQLGSTSTERVIKCNTTNSLLMLAVETWVWVHFIVLKHSHLNQYSIC